MTAGCSDSAFGERDIGSAFVIRVVERQLAAQFGLGGRFPASGAQSP
jgi:hypothetical protein